MPIKLEKIEFCWYNFANLISEYERAFKSALKDPAVKAVRGFFQPFYWTKVLPTSI